MTTVCPKCGYVRRPGDSAPKYECPQCGIIYAKYRPPGAKAFAFIARQREPAEAVAYNGLPDDTWASLAKILLLFGIAIVLRELFAFSSLFRRLDVFGQMIVFSSPLMGLPSGVAAGLSFIVALLPAGLLLWHCQLWRRMRITPLWLGILTVSVLLYFSAATYWLPHSLRFLLGHVKTAGAGGVLVTLTYVLLDLQPGEQSCRGTGEGETMTRVFVGLTLLLAHFIFYLPWDLVRHQAGWSPWKASANGWLILLLAALIVAVCLWLSEMRYRLAESAPGLGLLTAGTVMVVVPALLFSLFPATFMPGLSRRGAAYVALFMLGIGRKGATYVEVCFVIATTLLTMGSFRLFTGLLPQGQNPFRDR